jgi:hypothetical protein
MLTVFGSPGKRRRLSLDPPDGSGTAGDDPRRVTREVSSHQEEAGSFFDSPLKIML